MDGQSHLVCVNCGAVNRVPATRNALEARCGKCGRPLFSGKPADVDAAMFGRQVERGTLPVVVDVWAPWCGPCLAMAPEYARAAAALEPRIRFLKLNSDQAPELSARLGIRGIPTMILFRAGKEIARTSGAMRAEQITAWLTSSVDV
jgi:thioredoxin 2